MLEQNPVNEQRSDVLLFPMKLQEERWHAWKITLLLTHQNRQQSPALLRFFAFFFQFLIFEPTLFSMDFLTRVKLFQRDSNSFLWVPRKNMRSLMICSHTDRHKKGAPWDLFFFFFLQGPYRIITPWTWIKERMTKGGAVHLNDGEEGLCVILRVLQDVTWVGTTEARVD